MSGIFKLNSSDLYKGLTVVVLTALLGAILAALNGNGVNVTAYDWNAIVTVSLQAGVAYLIKNLLTTSDGNVLGAFGGK